MVRVRRVEHHPQQGDAAPLMALLQAVCNCMGEPLIGIGVAAMRGALRFKKPIFSGIFEKMPCFAGLPLDLRH